MLHEAAQSADSQQYRCSLSEHSVTLPSWHCRRVQGVGASGQSPVCHAHQSSPQLLH